MWYEERRLLESEQIWDTIHKQKNNNEIKLIGFPTFWLRVYLMKGIPETRRVH